MGKFDLPNVSELPPMNENTNKETIGELRLCDLPKFIEDDFESIFLNKQIDEDKQFRHKQAELKRHQAERVEHSVW